MVIQCKVLFASNQSAPEPIDAGIFYENLLQTKLQKDRIFEEMMSVNLPGAEGQRQADMAAFGMLSALSNFVGNQSNYGNGATYWSWHRR